MFEILHFKIKIYNENLLKKSIESIKSINSIKLFPFSQINYGSVNDVYITFK